MNVVLVHGFLNRGGIMASLARHLRSAGHSCYVPTLTPCDARCGLPVLAGKLRDYIDHELGPKKPFALVGFSMGALISRYYLVQLEGHLRVRAFFSIAGPHLGTQSAYLYPSEGVTQMRPHSAFLQDLEQKARAEVKVPTVCYWTPFDLMIRPIRSTLLPGAESMQIPSLVHSLLVFDPRLKRDLTARLAAMEPATSRGSTALSNEPR